LREQRGVDQREAAAAIGVSQPYLSLLERDQKGHTADHVRGTLERAAAYYGVHPTYLLSELHQEYIKSWVPTVDAPQTAGRRLDLVIGELRSRFGEDFTESAVAAAIGATTDTLKAYIADSLPITDSVAQQLSDLTGAPVAWLVPRPTAVSDRSDVMHRVVERAVASGMDPDELEALIDVWLSARYKKPSG
jgi:transcriptional regulator with XRE-family HTH domain